MLTLEANYSKKLGLPQYSSHQFSLTIRTELADIKQVDAEAARLYALLQSSVDRELQQPGFLPGESPKSNGHTNGNGRTETWACSDKQRELILKIIEEHKLDKQAIEQLAQERFSKGVKQLNKLEASGLIDELLAQHGDKPNGGRRSPFQKAGAR